MFGMFLFLFFVMLRVLYLTNDKKLLKMTKNQDFWKFSDFSPKSPKSMNLSRHAEPTYGRHCLTMINDVILGKTDGKQSKDIANVSKHLERAS